MERVETQQQMQVIIHHREPAHSHREYSCEFLDSIFFDPLFTV